MIGFPGGRRLLHSTLVTGPVAAAAFLAAPRGSIWQAAAWFLPCVLAGCVLAARLKVNAGTPLGRPLRLLMIGQWGYVAVSVAWFLWTVAFGHRGTFPSIVDAGYFGVYAVYAAFLLALLRGSQRARPIEKRIALIDATVLTLSASSLLWTFAIVPYLAANTSSATVATVLLYPVACLLLFALAAYVTFRVGIPNVPTAVLLWLWLGATAVGGVFYGVESAAGVFTRGEPVMVLWIVANTALGALAAHPRIASIVRWSVPDMGRLCPRRETRFGVGGRRRMGVVLGAALLPIAGHYVRPDHAAPNTLLVISALMLLLFMYRTGLLAGDLEEKSRLAAELDDAVGRLSRQRDQLTRYAAIVNSTDEAVVTMAPDGAVLDWNPGAEAMFGYAREEVLGRHVAFLSAPGEVETYDAMTRLVFEQGHASLERRQVRRDGSSVDVSVALSAIYDDDGVPMAVVGITQDISERKLRETRQHQDSKLESLGRLSAGLAHEINTPIQFVGDNARFLAEAYEDLIRIVLFYRGLLDSPEPLSWQERIERMRTAEAGIEFEYLQQEIPSAVAQTLEGIDRVSTIVRAMKTFSHPGNSEQVPADLNDALVATLTVSRYQVKNVAELTMDLGTLPPVMCNIADLNQVFLNLVVNAADAIEETGRRGIITVSTGVEGDDAVIRISDTGGGIPADVLPKIFEPFFTTKDVGHGTGQGLPLARGLIQDGHGGLLDVESTPGEGATFTIRLPIRGRAATAPGELAGASA